MKKIHKVLWFLAVLALPCLAWAGAVDDIKAGNNAARSGKLKKAVQFYDKAIKSGELSPDNLAIAYNNRGSAKDDLGQTDQAIRDFNRAIETNPRHAEAYYNRSYAYERKKLLKLALADIKKAATLDPKDAHYRDRHEYLLGLVTKPK